MALPANESVEDIKETQRKLVLALSLKNTPPYKIAKELGISRYMVGKIRGSEEFKALLKEEGDKAVMVARESFKAQLEEMAPLALAALKHNLEENKIEAVRTFIEVVGLKNREEEKQQDTSITVILPGTKETVIQTTGKTVEEGSDA